MEKMRSKNQIQKMEDDRFEKLWYIRNKSLEHCGRIKPTEGSKKAYERIEKEYNNGEPLCSCDSCRSRIEGELSTLRWVLGSEWGFLDT